MVYAEWQLLRQLVTASSWTDEPAVEVPQAHLSWQQAAAQASASGQDEVPAAKTPARPGAADTQAGRLWQTLEQGGWQMARAAAALASQRAAGHPAAEGTAGRAGARRPQQATVWAGAPDRYGAVSAQAAWYPAGSMQAVSRYFERDARRYG